MKGRKHREAGGVNDAEKDLDTKPEERTNAKKIDAAAHERKAGGRTHGKECKCKKCMGGKVERKEGGKVEGEEASARADRKPRKSGGSANATDNPFSSAKNGTAASGRKLESWMD